MLDLGLSFYSAAADDAREGSSSSRMDESGASNSSVVNPYTAVDEEPCSTRRGGGSGGGGEDDVCELSFGVLRGSGREEEVAIETRELFPVRGSRSWLVDVKKDGRGGGGGGKGGGSLVAVQEKKEKGEEYVKALRVKRRRRGPRSKSSQYRGVTFYRRTGRWESHIWLAKLKMIASAIA